MLKLATDSGCVGFYCPANGGKEVNFAFCIDECPHRCLSLPLLLALIREKEIVPGTYSVTEIPNPRQMVYLKRHRPYYIDPYYSTFALFGNAVHALIESQKDNLGDGYIVEERKTARLCDVEVVGKPDLIIESSESIVDYKTIKSYAIKKMLEGDFEDSHYKIQLNAYKWLFYPDAESLIIEAFVKDWSYDMWFKDGLKPLERVMVPIMEREHFLRIFTKMLQGHLDVEKDGKLPYCTKEEVWLQENPRSQNFGVPLRCRDYCEVHCVCPQYKEFLLAEGEDGKAKRLYPAG